MDQISGKKAKLNSNALTDKNEENTSSDSGKCISKSKWLIKNVRTQILLSRFEWQILFLGYFIYLSNCTRWTKPHALNFYAGGKPITPNDVTDSLSNGHTAENGAVVESVTKTEVSIDFYFSSSLYSYSVAFLHLNRFKNGFSFYWRVVLFFHPNLFQIGVTYSTKPKNCQWKRCRSEWCTKYSSFKFSCARSTIGQPCCSRR